MGPMTWQTALFLGEMAALTLALVSVPSVLEQRRARPTSAAVWLLLFLLVPFVGVFLWWTLGRFYLSRRKNRRQRRKAEVVARLADLRTALAPRSVTGPHPALAFGTAREQARQRIFSESDRVFGNRRTNHFRVFVDAAEAYPVFLAAIEAATDHVHFQFYIYEDDDTGRRFRDALIAAAERGVQVRVLVDAVGGAPVADEFMESLRAAGGEFETFMPVRLWRRQLSLNFRNHRKILIVDGRTAFTGGINIGDEYTRDWHDLAVQVDGPAVDQFQEVFAEDWHFARRAVLADPRYFGRFEAAGPLPLAGPAGSGERMTGRCRVVASGPVADGDNTMFELFFMASTTAQARIWIMTPYFIPDQAMLVALTTAARRGVDVRILVPQRSDVPFVQMACRSYYPDLVAAGVQVFEYTPAVLHAKMMLFDHDWVVLGSANVDIRSFRLNFEAGLFVEGEALNAHMAHIFEGDLRRSVQVTRRELDARGWWTRNVQALAHLFSPML